MNREQWIERARCGGAPVAPGNWAAFPEDLYGPGGDDYRAAVEEFRAAYCRRCPVRVECLRAGMQEEFGIWGGLTQAERRKVVQLNCRCGAPLDPLDMIGANRSVPFCTNCRPLVLSRNS